MYDSELNIIIIITIAQLKSVLLSVTQIEDYFSSILTLNKLPLLPNISNITKYFDILEFQVYQSENKMFLF